MILEYPLRKISKNNRVGNALKSVFEEPISDSITIEIPISFSLEGNEWTNEYICKVDSGAYMTLLPESAFSKLKPTRWIPYQLYGVVNTPECQINCKISKVKAKLKSPNNKESPIFELWVSFAESDNIPLLLGMLGILDKFKSTLNPIENIWTIEF